ncbi:MAG: bile acid:sodium symporter family protein [Leptospiraceae bacterium]|nr:bile acid:sodium symporter family protein [Leptospiraceae bacterium]
MQELDTIQLNFNPESLLLLNVILGFVMFGVALDLTVHDFRRLVRAPLAPIIGLVAQFVILPALSFGLIQILDLRPSLALGVLLVAACPGGNISNFIAHLAKGSTALSVSMTALSTAFAIFMTPFNITFWASLNPGTRQLLTDLQVDPLELFGTVIMLLGVPLVLGMWIHHKYPATAHKLRKPFRIFSLVFFGGFVVAALAANWAHFLKYVGAVFGLVLIHNALALALGYTAAFAARLEEQDRRAVSIEVGIQNSGLGLTLIFTFFNGLGGMALVAAWWGIWHIIAGMTVATFWSRFPPKGQSVN